MNTYTATLGDPEESQIIGNLFRIQALERRIHELYDKRRENPFLVFSQLGWGVEIDALKWKKERLEKRTRKLEGMRKSVSVTPTWGAQTHPQYTKVKKQETYAVRFLKIGRAHV